MVGTARFSLDGGLGAREFGGVHEMLFETGGTRDRRDAGGLPS